VLLFYEPLVVHFSQFLAAKQTVTKVVAMILMSFELKLQQSSRFGSTNRLNLLRISIEHTMANIKKNILFESISKQVPITKLD
jgi:hypothetical protein